MSQPGQSARRGFVNDSPRSFESAADREALRRAIRALDARLPLAVGPVVGGDAAVGGARFDSVDPSSPARTVASVSAAAQDTIAQAAELARADRDGWASLPQAERSEIFLRAAELLRERRFEIDALLVRETGKTGVEADAEVAEAVDFLEYYARSAMSLEDQRVILQSDAEQNRHHYMPRGTAAVIGPWNFPFAIPLGMATGPLVTGNRVLLKPAEQTPAAGQAVVELLRQAGVPASAIALLPGDGSVGQALVDHPWVDTILFTGSREVGLHIVARAAQTQREQQQVKRVVAEMGGKNCIIVDRTADLDTAVSASVASAFHFAGQKCSAASRLLVDSAIFDEFLARTAKAVEALRSGPGDEAGIAVTAMIDEEALTRASALADTAHREGRVVAQGVTPPEEGWYLRPLLVTDLPPGSDLLEQELFAPLLPIESFDELDEALDRVDSLPYALTGGVFSTSRESIERVVRRSPVGNLYVNRKITGAVVGRQPFGGNRFSGIGFKAGGPDYLLQFVNARVVAEALE